MFSTSDFLLIALGTSMEIGGINFHVIALNFGEIQMVAPFFHTNLVFCLLFDVIFLGFWFTWNEALGSLIVVASVAVPSIKNIILLRQKT